MVDFKKRLGNSIATKPIVPSEIYAGLDRASDKGPLRPAQESILSQWDEKFRSRRDVILKLNTGQGKTLIGLLILQAKLNEGCGPALYLCPNNQLLTQTMSQARQFGINFTELESDFSQSFLDSESILITSVQKLFNGLTKFGIGQRSVNVQSIVMDDAHACIDSIRDSLQIKVPYDVGAYSELRSLFETALRHQGMGTFEEIANQNPDAILPVPYWEWQDKNEEVVKILSRYSNNQNIRFAWEILKDNLANCQCVMSGKKLEISPYLPPLSVFGSYYKAKHRVFMSATVTDDAFLVKGLGLDRDTIVNSLRLDDESWAGEKMILVPSLIDESLDESAMVATFAPPIKRNYGTVALVPSFKKAEAWGGYGANIATKDTINNDIGRLLGRDFTDTLVIVNRYDGIDLPDNTCRILIFNGNPHSESLIDRYSESCRESSDITAIRTARTIEQGLGRSVRGEKDFCVIVLTGSSLVKSIRSRESRKHLSNQTRKQIEIGLEIAELAKDDITKGSPAKTVLSDLIRQCLTRDEGWKAFYVEQMDTVTTANIDETALRIFEEEFLAEKRFQEGNIEGAISVLQAIVDRNETNEYDKGWYLQEIARYLYNEQKIESNKIQISAHRQNKNLMKPRSGMVFKKLKIISQKRMENILTWVKVHDNYEELIVEVEDILDALQFGTKSSKFEDALDRLARAIGFIGERPDKEWKEGPDNLWALDDVHYMLFECKSEVDLIRKEIQKSESDQMNSSCAWFDRNYSRVSSSRVMIIPTRMLANAAAFNDPSVQIMDRYGLGRLVKNTRLFFREFKNMDFNDLSEKKTQELINAHQLSVEDVMTKYTEAFRPHRVKN